MDWLKHSLVKLGAAVVMMQLAYWLLFVPNFVEFRPDERPEFLEQTQVEMAEIASPDSAGLKGAKFAELDPEVQLYESGYYAVRVTFAIEELPEAGIALLDNSAGDHVRFYVNGALLRGTGEATLPYPTYHGLQKRIVPISSGLLREGTNKITSIATIDIAREARLLPPLLGDFEATEAAFSRTDFLFNDWPNITIAITFVVALILGFIALRAGDRDVPLWMFLVAVSWAIHSLFYRWVNIPLAGEERGLFYALPTLFMTAVWPIFVDAWTEHRMRFFREAMLGVFAVAAAIVIYWLAIHQGPSAFTHVERVIELTGPFFVFATLARLIWHFVRNPREERVWEAAILILLASLIVYFLYNTFVNDQNVRHLASSQPLLLLALAIGFLSRKFHLFRSAEAINTLLQGRLDQREAELAEVYAREKVWVREQAFDEERQRIMRDMHDGLGSQLMGMLLAAKRGKAEPVRVADGLQQVIDELRLMIDSLDSVGDSLGVALSGLRSRLETRVEDAGFKFIWKAELGVTLPSYVPRKTLQLFRIMQEGVTNALKHSDGSQIAIMLDYAPDRPEWLRVRISDDGNGKLARRAGGHGLDNMQARAGQIGGSVELKGGGEGEGSLVTILIPPDNSEIVSPE